MPEVPGLMLNGVTFCCWIFFLRGKVCDANTVSVANFGYLVKNSNRPLKILPQDPQVAEMRFCLLIYFDLWLLQPTMI